MVVVCVYYCYWYCPSRCTVDPQGVDELELQGVQGVRSLCRPLSAELTTHSKYSIYAVGIFLTCITVL